MAAAKKAAPKAAPKKAAPKAPVEAKVSAFETWWKNEGMQLVVAGHVGANMMRHAINASKSETTFDEFYSANVDLCNSTSDIKKISQAAFEA